MVSPSPNPYASPATDPSKSASNATGSRSLPLFIVAMGLVLFDLVLIGLSRGRFGEMFADFELALSWITAIAMGIGMPIFLGVLLVATVAINCVPARPSFKNLSNSIAFCLALACLTVYVIGVASPLLRLITSLS